MLSSACASCTSFPRLTERPVWSLVLAGIMPFFPSASLRGLLSSACKTQPPNFSSVAQTGKCKFTTAIQRQDGCPLPCQPDRCDSSETCSPCLAPLLYLALWEMPIPRPHLWSTAPVMPFTNASVSLSSSLVLLKTFMFYFN